MPATNRAVVRCYNLWDLHRLAGMTDLTEGLFGGRDISYEEAQRIQINTLLDHIRCQQGSDILDIGSGYGTLLEAATSRGANAFGVTISPDQLAFCKRRGTNAELLNYKDALRVHPEWRNRYSGIVANGSMEHCVQPEEALDGLQDHIYTEFFETCYQLLQPGSRLVTTCIHFLRRPDPQEILRGPYAHKWGSELFHFSMLLTLGGAFYPIQDQLTHCARGYFKLEHEGEHTDDYRRTSEEWMCRWKQAFLRPSFYWAMAKKFVGGPRSFIDGFIGNMITQSWNWQFRPPAPTVLKHQVWLRSF